MRIIKREEQIRRENAELKEIIISLENQVENLTNTVKQISENVQEVIKKDDSEMPIGDYTNPIQIPEDGLSTESGKWYYVDDKDLPHEAKQDAFVTPEDFNDRTWFDFV